MSRHFKTILAMLLCLVTMLTLYVAVADEGRTRGIKYVVTNGEEVSSPDETDQPVLTLRPASNVERERLNTPQQLAMKAFLICQRRTTNNTFDTIKDCSPPTPIRLIEGDRVKLQIKPETDGFIYMFSLNDLGQIQLLIPSDIFLAPDNQVKKGTVFQFPPGDDWFKMDSHTNTTEHVRLYFSPYRIVEFEQARNLNVNPEKPNNTRGLNNTPEAVGRLVKAPTRGFEPDPRQETIVQVGGQSLQVNAIAHTGKDVIVIDFKLRR